MRRTACRRLASGVDTAPRNVLNRPHPIREENSATMKIRKYLTSIAVAGLLVMSGGIAHAGGDRPPTGPNVPLPKPVPGAVVAGKPFNLHPLCKSEDATIRYGSCRWDARLLGNGVGNSYVVTARGVTAVKLSPVPARGTLAYFPQCKARTFTGQICWYSANTRGTGLGRDYYFTSGGVKKYLPYQMIES